MDSIFYFIFIFVSGLAVYYSFKQQFRKFAYKSDPRRVIRERIAEEMGLTMQSNTQDVFALNGSIERHQVSLFTNHKPFGRTTERIEVQTNKPSQIKMSIQSGMLSALRQNFGRTTAKDVFSQQFVVGGKDAHLFNELTGVEVIKHNLLEAHYRTGGLRIRVKNGRITCDETGFSFQTTRIKLNHTKQLINTLCYIAKAIDHPN